MRAANCEEKKEMESLIDTKGRRETMEKKDKEME